MSFFSPASNDVDLNSQSRTRFPIKLFEFRSCKIPGGEGHSKFVLACVAYKSSSISELSTLV